MANIFHPRVYYRMAEPADFEEIEHGADISLRVQGATWAGLLQNAGYALSRQLAGPLPAAVEERRFALTALDRESLLVDWLNEINYYAEKEGLVFGDIRVISASPTSLRAVLRGGRVGRLETEIKAVTYHNLAVSSSAGGFTATLTFDV